VIIADGVESRLARCLGWKTALELTDIESCAFARVKSTTEDSKTCVFYLGGSIAPGGYAWIFPRGKGIANVGLGVLGTRSAPGRALQLLTAFIEKRFPGCAVTDVHCGGVPVAKWMKPLVRDGAMLVGDAARQVDCLSGGGISYALYAGRTAGTVAAQAFTRRGFSAGHLKHYGKEWAKNFGRRQRWSYSLKKAAVSYSDAFLDQIAAALVKGKGRKLNYVRVFMRAFSKDPVLMLKAFLLYR
jgi:digeranylgeranylglycerophospholipid reductase